MKKQIAIIGGGAAGFFCAALLAEHLPDCEINIYERSEKVLQKVKISGGGRCNVTNACSDPALLVKNYPRGEKELRGPFNRFGPTETIDWFKQHGVILKTENDGRIFPVTDSSQTILDCLLTATIDKGVKIIRKTGLEHITKTNNAWEITTNNGKVPCDYLVFTTGSSALTWDLIHQNTGHQIVAPVPSLFTFNTDAPILSGLQGVSVPNGEVSILESKFSAKGPILTTHWGLSGPAVLRLSAVAARHLHTLDYSFDINVNWKSDWKPGITLNWLQQQKKEHAKKKPENLNVPDIPSRLWDNIVKAANIPSHKIMADVSNAELEALCNGIHNCRIAVDGKSTFKDEFVTSGGVDTSEIDFKTFESKLHPNLFFAGEVLNIDAVTGGFNFQAAWTGAWHIAQAIIEKASEA